MKKEIIVSAKSFKNNFKFNSIYRKVKEFLTLMMKQYGKRLIFPILGLSSTIWILIRVIPKPSRATYPCMRVAAPLASSFVAYIIGLGASIFAFRKAKEHLRGTRYILAGVFLIAGLVVGLWTVSETDKPVYATYSTIQHPANTPIGEANGINPGRVVWVHDPDATNENCTNSYGQKGNRADDDGWFLSKNNDQGAIDRMLSEALRSLTGESTDADAWDALFKYFNQQKHGIENMGYTSGEKIFLKLNATSTYGKGQSWGNITNNYDANECNSYGIAETSPHVVLAVLKQLVNVCGIAQQDISVGDPMKLLYNHCYDLWHDEFPDIHYIANEGAKGRIKAIAGKNPSIFYSDKGRVIVEKSDRLYTVIENADYMINIPTLKAHARAGITLFAKNHFGSHTRIDATHLHPALVAPDAGPPTRTKIGIYRVQVDLMGHELLGGNTMLFLVDALWAGSEACDPPTKWTLSPFNNDWTSSIFASQDQVAIESVAFDFLRTEYNGENGKVSYPNMPGVDDYLHQAADSICWPVDVSYDPEADGTPIKSLGVHEHWNNPTDKQYSRNLGTDEGIELVYIKSTSSRVEEDASSQAVYSYTLYPNYPNPFNPSTTIKYDLPENNHVELIIYDVLGNEIYKLVEENQSSGTHSITWNGTTMDGIKVASGIYFYCLKANEYINVRKMILTK